MLCWLMIVNLRKRDVYYFYLSIAIEVKAIHTECVQKWWSLASTQSGSCPYKCNLEAVVAAEEALLSLARDSQTADAAAETQPSQPEVTVVVEVEEEDEDSILH